MRGVIAAGFLVTACGVDAPTLVAAGDIKGDSIPAPLTGTPGDAVRGQYVFANRDAGHCVLCHSVAQLNVEFQGNVGPALTGIGDRLSPAQLRMRVVDYQRIQPGAPMPSYYRNHDLNQVEETYLGATILSAQDVEDVVAYMSALKLEKASE